MAHDCLAKFPERLSLEGLGHVVTNHLSGGTVFNFQVAFLNLVGQKEITDVKSTSSLAGASLTIVFKQDSALVVLVQNILFNSATLGFHKKSGP